jgi:hypothetical protein
VATSPPVADERAAGNNNSEKDGQSNPTKHGGPEKTADDVRAFASLIGQTSGEV